MSTNNAINGKSGNIGIGIAEGAPDDNTIISTNTNGNIIFDPNGTGWFEIDSNVGIGTSSVNAPLQFTNSLANRRIVLYETANNDHQFHGFGINSAIMRYQVGETTSDHVFYAGASSSLSHELLRIKGTGNVGFGVSSPHGVIQVPSGDFNRKIILNETADNDHQYFGFGTNSSSKELRYQIDRAASDGGHVFYTGASSSSSTELFRIVGNGDVIVNSGTFWPSRLPSGSMYMEGNGSATTITAASTFYKIAGTTTSNSLNEFTMPANNKLLYSGTPTITASINVATTITQNQILGSSITISIYKNGSHLTGTNSQATLALTSTIVNICANTLVSLATNDYIEIYILGSVNGQTATAANMQVSISAT